MQLHPCTGCRRHVVVGAASCPFCGHQLSSDVPGPRSHLRLSRAAVFVAATVTGCWTNKTEPKHVEQQQQAVVQDAGTVDAPAAQNLDVEEDNMERNRHQNHPCVDTPQGPMCAPYGAPPQRRRIV